MRKEERFIVADLITRAISSNQQLVERVDWARDGGQSQHRYMVAQEAVDPHGTVEQWHSRQIHRKSNLSPKAKGRMDWPSTWSPEDRREEGILTPF